MGKTAYFWHNFFGIFLLRCLDWKNCWFYWVCLIGMNYGLLCITVIMGRLKLRYVSMSGWAYLLSGYIAESISNKQGEIDFFSIIKELRFLLTNIWKLFIIPIPKIGMKWAYGNNLTRSRDNQKWVTRKHWLYKTLYERAESMLFCTHKKYKACSLEHAVLLCKKTLQSSEFMHPFKCFNNFQTGDK